MIKIKYASIDWVGTTTTTTTTTTTATTKQRKRPIEAEQSSNELPVASRD